MTEPMTETAAETASEPTFFSRLKSTFAQPRTLFIVALALSLGAAGAALGRQVYLKPIRATASTRYQSHLALMRLYDLQMAYRGANGAFANDLPTLLATAPDGPKLREQLAASVDIETLAVVGDAHRFRLEANIRDEQRTSVKIRGPLGER